MRISDWVSRFNVSVRRNEERPDNPPGEVVYRLTELFTTRDGSWEPSDKPGTLPQWARDEHLRPFGAPDYFDDAGGDHHLFARVLDEQYCELCFRLRGNVGIFGANEALGIPCAFVH
jgi:hypothetical protein